MAAEKRFRYVDFQDVDPCECPCGLSRRAFLDDPDRVASFHEVDIKADSQVHYHKRLTEIYYVLEGHGHMEVDAERLPLRPGCSVLIKPGCRHRAVGRMKIAVVAIPPFDPQDEWFD